MFNSKNIDNKYTNNNLSNRIVNRFRNLLSELFSQNKNIIESNFEELTLRISQPGFSIEQISIIFYEAIKSFFNCEFGYILYKDFDDNSKIGFADADGYTIFSKNILDKNISSSFSNDISSHKIDYISRDNNYLLNYIVFQFDRGTFYFFNKQGGFSNNDIIYLNRVSRLYKVTIQRIEYEIKLKEEQIKTNSLIDSAYFGVLIIDGNGYITHANRVLAKNFNLTCSDLVGNSIKDFDTYFSNSISTFSKLIESRDGLFSSLDFELKLDNGKCKYFKISGSYLNPNDQSGGIYIIIDEITDLKNDQLHQVILNNVLNILNSRVSSEIYHLGDVSALLKNQLKVDGIFFRKVTESGDLDLLYNIGLNPTQLDKEKKYFNLKEFNCLCHRIVKSQIGDNLTCSSYGTLYINNIREFIKGTDLNGLLGFCHTLSGFESMIFIPLKSGCDVVGVMTLGSRNIDYFDEKMILLLEAVGSSVGIDIAKCDAENNFVNSQLEKKLILDGLGKHLVVNYLDSEMNIIRSSSSSDSIINNGSESICGHKCFTSFGNIIKTCDHCSAKKAFETGEISYGTLYLTNGRVFYTISTPNINNDGKIIGVIHMGLDITDMKNKEKELENAKIFAEKADKAKTEFIYGITHELRTPLNGVLGGIELLSYDDSFNKGLDIIKNGGEQLLLLINDLLDFGKIESGNLSLLEVDFNLVDVTNRLENTFYTMVHEKGINLFIKGNCDLKIVGDPGRITQVLNNLVSNAIKFTNKGTVTVEVNNSIIDEGYLVDFIITDTGEGISQDRMGILFDRFIQAKNSFSPKYGGTGLGLSLVKSFVDLMNGSIKVESELGKGSEFTVSIPFRVSNNSSKIVCVESAEIDKSLKVLLVEDEKINQYVASILLGKKNHSVVIADSIESVNEVINKDINFDIILLDYQLIDTNGEFVFNLLKQKGIKGKVVALTGSTHLYDYLIGLGFDGVLFKPFDIKSFNELVSKLL